MPSFDLIQSRQVFCSAGISHFLLYPNGDIYRCMADYNARRERMFNVREAAWQLDSTPKICLHNECVCGCDVDWATKWIKNQDGSLKERVLAQAEYYTTSKESLWAAQTFERPLVRVAHFLWAPTLTCNYTCIYCGCAAGVKRVRQDFPSADPELTVDEWLDAWQRILVHFDYAIVDLSGGEPLLSPATLPVIDLVAHKFAVGLTTNLSENSLLMGDLRPSSVRDFGRLGRLHVGLCQVTASLHPSSRGFNPDMFKGRVLYLKNRGFHVSINFVGHPVQLYLADEYKRWADACEVRFIVSPWVGADNDGHVANYTEADVDYLNRHTEPHRRMQKQSVFRALRHRITLDLDHVRAMSGSVVILDGTLENTSTGSWRVFEDADSFAVGARLVRKAAHAEALRECRSPLPPGDRVPGDLAAFQVRLDLKDVEPGLYELVFDVVLEGKFWMAERGARPVVVAVEVLSASGSPSTDVRQLAYDILVEPTAMSLRIGQTSHLRGSITNLTPYGWDQLEPPQALKLGGRLIHGGRVLREFRSRSIIWNLQPSETAMFDLPIELPGLAPCNAELVLDVVNEGRYWFTDFGVRPFCLPVDIDS